jgi:DNA-binding response OmpR family regulator
MERNCAATLTPEFAPTLTNQTAAGVTWPIQVLLIEDDPESAELVRIRLTEDAAQPFRMEWRPNLLEGMDRLIEPGIDVVLLDLGLPELSGYKSYQAVALAAGNRVPIVILTADDRALSKEIIMEFGAADYLLKHQSTSLQLRQALHQAILRRRQPELFADDSERLI